MAFFILNHLEELEKYGTVKEYPTWIKATCPICSGKLKISKNPTKNGAYACYSDNCHLKYGNPIRKLLHKYKPFGQSKAFSNKVALPKKLVEVVEPVPINGSASDFLTSELFSMPVQLRLPGKLYTYFDYSDFRIVRLDTKESGELKKDLYPEYQVSSGDWIKGYPDTLKYLPIFNRRYLQPSMVFSEGEKAATIGQKLGLASVTFPAFAYSERSLDNYAKRLATDGLTNVLYMTDNDEAGIKKAELLSTHFWKHGIGTNIVNLVSLFSQYRDVVGFDIYDAYKEKLVNKENIVSVLEELICL